MKTYYLERFDPDRFKPKDQRGETVVKFKEFLYDPKRQKGMVQVTVAEENLTQNFWIEIGQRRERWYVRAARGCGIVPTMGVQRALDLVHEATQE